MPESPIRGIAVLDIGSTNVKAVLFDAQLSPVAEEIIPSVRIDAPSYLAINPEPVMAFANRVLPEFDRMLPVDVIVPCSHGSSAVLLDATAAPTMPVMSYEAEPPEQIISAYARIAPGFGEVFAPTNPQSLTLARQFYWQESLDPEAFSRTAAIVPLAQYAGFRMSGVLANEVSAMGAQTHVWAPQRKTYSRLAIERGWASRFAPLRSAWQKLGAAHHLNLRGRGDVLTGIHDSNANLLLHLHGAPKTLLSTGTWIIGFVPGVPLESLDPRFDQVSNTTVFGDPIASCRFMGGREFEIVSKGAPPQLASSWLALDLAKRGVTASPSFTDSGGPAPGTGNNGRITGRIETDAEHASLASLYCAQMSALALRKIGNVNSVVVDGPFAQNAAYMELLASCLPQTEVFAASGSSGTALGAASLALMSLNGEPSQYAPSIDPQYRLVEPIGPVLNLPGQDA